MREKIEEQSGHESEINQDNVGFKENAKKSFS